MFRAYRFATANAINGLMEGIIYVGSQNSMLVNVVPKIISEFAQTYSNIDINLREYPHADFEPLLQVGDLDLGFMSQDNIKGFEFHPLFNDDLCLIMNKDHPFAEYDKIPINSLNGCDFIMPIPGWDDPVNAILSKRSFTANNKYMTASDTAAIALVASNQGVYILSALQTSLLPNNIISKPLEGDFFRTMGFTVKSLKNSSPAIQEFVKVTKKVVNKILAENPALTPVNQ